MTTQSREATSSPKSLLRAAALAIFTISGAVSAHADTQYCAAPPPVVRDMSAETFYVDRPKSIQNKAVVQRNESALAGLDRGLTAIIEGADVALNRSSETAGRCSVQWLAVWAREEAMLGRMGQQQAEFERKWRAAGIAIAYLKLKAFASQDDRAVIEGWLRKLALRVAAGDGARNNHHYWVGLVETAVGVATDDAVLLADGRRHYDDAMKDIAADGSLRLEMTRAGRALHYHNYALAPLVVMAELAASRGEDWYGRGNGAIHRLAEFTMGGLANPVAFSRLAGAPVEVPTDGIVGWVTFYAKRFPDKVFGVNPLPAYNYYWLGGDTRATAAAWSRAAS